MNIPLRSSTQSTHHGLLQICILPAGCGHMEQTTSRSCPTHQPICQPLPGVCSSGHQGDVTPAWLPCPVMLLPSFVHSAPYIVKKYFILEHLLCLVNDLLFWSTFLFCPTGCRRQPCTHLADVCCKRIIAPCKYQNFK